MVQFLVNGSRGSAAGVRAERIAAALDGVAPQIACRPSNGRGVLTLGRSVRRTRADLVYAMDLGVGPVAAALARRRNTPFVVDTGDAPADFFRQVQASRARVAAAEILERVGYGTAARVIVRGPYHVEALKRRGYPVSLVPDGVDLDVFAPRDVSGLRSRMGLSDVLTVGMQGHFTWYPKLGGGMGCELIRALAYLGPNVHAILIGSGPGLGQLRALAQSLGVSDKLTVLGQLPYERLPEALSLCDVAVLTQTDDPSSWIRTTGKLPGYLANGRYILASRVGTAADLLPEEMLIDYHGAWDGSYPERLAERLDALARDRTRLTRGLELRALAEPFSYPVVAAKAAQVIRTLLEVR